MFDLPLDGMVARPAHERSVDAELDWPVAHWRLLNGGVLPFDDAEFRAIEARIIDHSGTSRFSLAHALADQSGLDRGGELAAVTVPTLVIAAPADPVNPPAVRSAGMPRRLARRTFRGAVGPRCAEPSTAPTGGRT